MKFSNVSSYDDSNSQIISWKKYTQMVESISPYLNLVNIKS